MKINNELILLFQRESRGPTADRAVQTDQTPQGFDILHVMDAGWFSDSDRKQRQDGQADEVQRRNVESGGPGDRVSYARRYGQRRLLHRGHDQQEQSAHQRWRRRLQDIRDRLRDRTTLPVA